MEKIATDEKTTTTKKQQKISLIWTYNFRRRILGCYTDILKITEDMFWKLFR